MCKIDGISTKIKRINFLRRGKIGFSFEDGREVFVPLSRFPDVEKLTKEQQKKWRILDDIFFDFDIPTFSKVFSIEQIMSL
jgi:hypothetical protein